MIRLLVGWFPNSYIKLIFLILQSTEWALIYFMIICIVLFVLCKTYFNFNFNFKSKIWDRLLAVWCFGPADPNTRMLTPCTLVVRVAQIYF